ncbi:HAD family hydrolase [Rossellomorea aquimaris]|uniref:HAD family hydrolase n=1 Tax=Rossellomorea aquimaris TaxID=189382 RepID=UPI001CD5346E|nr:HAD family hydrolase [Rossellomorea aquimaris]MCA1053893.1 HAD family hydrolase [Rossellomorea aquimaris]
MIKAVFFDLDDTLLWDSKSIKHAFEETCKYAGSKVTVVPETLEEEVRKEARKLYSSYDTYEFTQMIGINPFEGLWGDFWDEGHEQFRMMAEIVPDYRQQAWTNGLENVGINDEGLGKELAERFRLERKNHPYVYHDTYHVLDELKDDYTLVLLTNGSPQLQNLKLQMTTELIPYFKEIVISGAIGRGKPDTAMFMHALDRLSLKPEEVVMVGDNLKTDILGSRRTGIRNVWINRHELHPEEVVPDYEIKELSEIIDVIKNL